MTAKTAITLTAIYLRESESLARVAATFMAVTAVMEGCSPAMARNRPTPHSPPSPHFFLRGPGRMPHFSVPSFESLAATAHYGPTVPSVSAAVGGKTFRDRLDGRDSIEFRKQPGTKRAGFQGVRLKPPEQPPVDPYYDR
jgi:hypothetical protein